MFSNAERYKVGGSPLYLRIDEAAAHMIVPAGHIDAARKVVDLIRHTLHERGLGFSLHHGENTVDFRFGEVHSGRIKQALDGETFRSMMSELQEKIPDVGTLNQRHAHMSKSWAARSEQPSTGRALS